jgi:hypothetical protein
MIAIYVVIILLGGLVGWARIHQPIAVIQTCIQKLVNALIKGG